MSIRNAYTKVKSYFSTLLTQQPGQEGTGEPSNRFEQGIFGGAGTSGTSRKRLACNVFEPEITDDEDDILGVPSFQSYQPISKRLRPETEFEMMNRHKNNYAPSEPSTSKSAMGYGDPRRMEGNPHAFGGQPVFAGTSREEKSVEVITLDDDADRAGVEGSSKKNSNPDVNRKSLSAKSKEMVPVKPNLSSPMKAAKNRDGNRFSKFWGNLGKRLAGTAHSSAIRLQEKQQYKQLLMAYDVMVNNETYKKFPLTKSKVDQEQLKAIYNRFGASPSDATVSLRFKPFLSSTTTNHNSPNCKPTRSLLPLPRLFSTPCDYFTASTSRPERLAIQPTPEVVDLESESIKDKRDVFLSPITPVTSRRKELSPSLSPSKGAGIYSNLEEALNNSAAMLDELGASEPLPIEAAGDSTSKTEADIEEEEDEDISIIGERVVNKSRNKSVNTLALEQTSCRYIDQKWLDGSMLTWREDKKQRDDRILEETKTMSILRRESTLEKDLEEKIRRKLTLTEYIVLEEPPLEIPELTEEMVAIIQHSKARGHDNEVLAQVRLSKDTISITRGDVRTLGPSQWLNDNVINTYMGLIVLRSKLGNFPSVYAFQTFFYPKLLKEGYSNSLKRWTRKDDIFAHDLIILPIHLGLHWCLACIDLRKKSISYFDSLGGENNKCLHSLLDYITREMKERKQMDLNKSEWQLVNVRGIPHQQNGSDCGMFACKFAEYLSRDSDFTFSQENMPYFRDRMVYELVRSDLMHP